MNRQDRVRQENGRSRPWLIALPTSFWCCSRRSGPASGTFPPARRGPRSTNGAPRGECRAHLSLRRRELRRLSVPHRNAVPQSADRRSRHRADAARRRSQGGGAGLGPDPADQRDFRADDGGPTGGDPDHDDEMVAGAGEPARAAGVVATAVDRGRQPGLASGDASALAVADHLEFHVRRAADLDARNPTSISCSTSPISRRRRWAAMPRFRPMAMCRACCAGVGDLSPKPIAARSCASCRPPTGDLELTSARSPAGRSGSDRGRRGRRSRRAARSMATFT